MNLCIDMRVYRCECNYLVVCHDDGQLALDLRQAVHFAHIVALAGSPKEDRQLVPAHTRASWTEREREREREKPYTPEIFRLLFAVGLHLLDRDVYFAHALSFPHSQPHGPEAAGPELPFQVDSLGIDLQLGLDG